MSLSSKHDPILAQHKVYAYVFKNRQKKETELSKCVWDLKDKNVTNYSITLSIVKRTSGYNSVTNSSNLFFRKTCNLKF